MFYLQGSRSDRSPRLPRTPDLVTRSIERSVVKIKHNVILLVTNATRCVEYFLII
jgi:hypothetical protein